MPIVDEYNIPVTKFNKKNIKCKIDSYLCRIFHQFNHSRNTTIVIINYIDSIATSSALSLSFCLFSSHHLVEVPSTITKIISYIFSLKNCTVPHVHGLENHVYHHLVFLLKDHLHFYRCLCHHHLRPSRHQKC